MIKSSRDETKMMKLAVASYLLLALTVYQTSAYTLGEWKVQKGYKPRLNPFRGFADFLRMDMLGNRVGIDPMKCFADMEVVQSEQFVPCQDFMTQNEDISDFLNYTVASADKFCKSNCSNLIPDILNRMIADCGVSPSDVPTGMLPFISKVCHEKIDVHQTCLQVWTNLRKASLPQQYLDCVQTFRIGSSCPDSCKEADKWVNDKLGCCYRLLEDFDKTQSETLALFLTEEEWETCGLKEPSTC